MFLLMFLLMLLAIFAEMTRLKGFFCCITKKIKLNRSSILAIVTVLVSM